jgi:hypothetical protein
MGSTNGIQRILIVTVRNQTMLRNRRVVRVTVAAHMRSTDTPELLSVKSFVSERISPILDLLRPEVYLARALILSGH